MKTSRLGPVAASGSLRALATAAAACKACPLYAHATQTVFGEGPARAALALVGEQPGDREDLAGHPFVGPAGAVLDEALAAAGVPRDAVYLTNAILRADDAGARAALKKALVDDLCMAFRLVQRDERPLDARSS